MGHEKTEPFDQDKGQPEQATVTYQTCFANAADALDGTGDDVVRVALADEWRHLGLAIADVDIRRHREGLRREGLR